MLPWSPPATFPYSYTRRGLWSGTDTCYFTAVIFEPRIPIVEQTIPTDQSRGSTYQRPGPLVTQGPVSGCFVLFMVSLQSCLTSLHRVNSRSMTAHRPQCTAHPSGRFHRTPESRGPLLSVHQPLSATASCGTERPCRPTTVSSRWTVQPCPASGQPIVNLNRERQNSHKD
jgi:hypothetical protein